MKEKNPKLYPFWKGKKNDTSNRVSFEALGYLAVIFVFLGFMVFVFFRQSDTSDVVTESGSDIARRSGDFVLPPALDTARPAAILPPSSSASATPAPVVSQPTIDYTEVYQAATETADYWQWRNGLYATATAIYDAQTSTAPTFTPESSGYRVPDGWVSSEYNQLACPPGVIGCTCDHYGCNGVSITPQP